MRTEEDLALYTKLIEQHPQIEKKGKTMPYTSINGHMFSFLDKEGKMGLRLSKEERTLFIETFNSQLMEQHGRVLKEYVEIPPTLLHDTTLLLTYLDKSLTYVAGLKPKTTKKKKKD